MLLFKIEKEGLVPSHLLGTVHFNDPRVSRMPEAAEDILRRCDRVIFESDFRPESMFKEHAEAIARGISPDYDLEEALGEKHFALVAEAMMRKVGIPEEVTAFTHPWLCVLFCFDAIWAGSAILTAASTKIALDSALTMSLEMVKEALDQMVAMDADILRKAQDADKPLCFLENPLAAFLRLTDGEAIPLLKIINRKSFEERKDNNEQMIQAYLSGDLATLDSVYHQMLANIEPPLRRLMRTLNEGRSLRWIPEIDRQLQRGGAMICVGACHLVELLRILSGMGYRISKAG